MLERASTKRIEANVVNYGTGGPGWIVVVVVLGLLVVVLHLQKSVSLLCE